MDKDKIKIETEAGGMAQMAEIMAPGTRVYREKCDECERYRRLAEELSAQLQDTRIQLEEKELECERWKTEFMAGCETNSQSPGIMSFIILSMKRLKVFAGKLSFDQLALMRTMLMDTLQNCTQKNLMAVNEVTQLPDRQSDSPIVFNSSVGTVVAHANNVTDSDLGLQTPSREID